MRAQASVKQTSTTEQLKRENHACKLEQGPKPDAVLACTTGTATLPLAEAGQHCLSHRLRLMQVLVCLHSTEHRGHFELTRIFWTLEPMQGMGVPSN